MLWNLKLLYNSLEYELSISECIKADESVSEPETFLSEEKTIFYL